MIAELPVDEILPALNAALVDEPVVILEAPPGSGKTTRVAPYLARHLLSDREAGERLFLLQPRRVAARAAAERIAVEQRWSVGQEVGYQVRFQNRTSAATRVVVATEGVLVRRLVQDPVLSDTRVVIFDEFHERSINSDLLLGMLRQVQTVLRDDLRLVIMSATLDSSSLQAFLPAAPLLKVGGTLFPVDVSYQPAAPLQKLDDQIAAAVKQLMHRAPGDILVFLPGQAEIYRGCETLRRLPELREWLVQPLHGSLPLEEQTHVLAAGDRRRVILATNVAETSLTIEGISAVVDSGLVRVLRFDPAVGLDRLSLEPICQSSATQRAGRAGRLGPGHCVRLWDVASQRARAVHLEPEVRRTDLAAAVLQLYHWGEPPADFPWLDKPRPEALEQARTLLQRIGALQENSLTPLGRTMTQLPLPPRLARMLIEAHRFGTIESCALVAALLSERDPFLRGGSDRTRKSPGSANRLGSANRAASDRTTSDVTTKRRAPQMATSAGHWDCDVSQRVAAIQHFLATGDAASALGEIHRAATRAIMDVAKQLQATIEAELGAAPARLLHDSEAIPRALLAAFPDRVARRRSAGDARALMVGGKGVRLATGSGVQQPELFLCVDVDGASGEATVRQASALKLAWLPTELIEEREELFFHPSMKQVTARKRCYFDDLLLSETPSAIHDEAACQQVLRDAASRDLIAVLPPDDSDFQQFVTRVNCLREWAPELELPQCDHAWLAELLNDLVPGRRSFAELREAPWLDWLQARLTAPQRQALERECPERMLVPSGNRIRIHYVVGKSPVLSARIQELFSWKETPRIAFGRVPLLLHLLAPNMRPQQVTDDLASFWQNTYHVVRKELRRRYPKHAWPEDPWQAEPVKRR